MDFWLNWSVHSRRKKAIWTGALPCTTVSSLWLRPILICRTRWYARSSSRWMTSGGTIIIRTKSLPEMRLLKLSIRKDGFTMPVVVARDGKEHVVVDGFHRRQVAKMDAQIRKSLGGYLPVVRLDKSIEDRITSTVRHNMARGTHQVELTARLVTLLRKHSWTNEKIGKELGMDPDEVLRLKQMQGLAEAFANQNLAGMGYVPPECCEKAGMNCPDSSVFGKAAI